MFREAFQIKRRKDINDITITGKLLGCQGVKSLSFALPPKKILVEQRFPFLKKKKKKP